MTKKNKERNLEILYKHRMFIDSERIKTAHIFDRYLFTFATGALYLSVLSLEQFGDVLEYKELLLFGWIFLGVSSLSILMALGFSKKASVRAIDITDSRIKNINKGRSSKKKYRNNWNKFVVTMNWIGSVSFIVGLIFLFTFYYHNL